MEIYIKGEPELLGTFSREYADNKDKREWLILLIRYPGDASPTYHFVEPVNLDDDELLQLDKGQLELSKVRLEMNKDGCRCFTYPVARNLMLEWFRQLSKFSPKAMERYKNGECSILVVHWRDIPRMKRASYDKVYLGRTYAADEKKEIGNERQRQRPVHE